MTRYEKSKDLYGSKEDIATIIIENIREYLDCFACNAYIICQKKDDNPYSYRDCDSVISEWLDEEIC